MSVKRTTKVRFASPPLHTLFYSFEGNEHLYILIYAKEKGNIFIFNELREEVMLEIAIINLLLQVYEGQVDLLRKIEMNSY